MRKIIFLTSIFSLLFLPLSAFAEQLQYDVAITTGSVSFSPAQFYVGDTVRIYANITNMGSKDITGGVTFYQGPSALAAPSPFSLKANGVTEDVWIDWTPVEGTYNIMVKIETNTPDQNSSNNVYVTPMMTITKRPPPPPPPVVQTALPTASAQQTAPPSQKTTAVPSQTTFTILTAAKKIAEEISPKLPVNPSVSSKKTSIAQVSRSQNTPVSPSTQPEKMEGVPLLADLSNGTQQPAAVVVPENVQQQNPPAPTTPNQNSQEFEKVSPSIQDQSDPVRTGITAAVVATIILLGVGVFFMVRSKE